MRRPKMGSNGIIRQIFRAKYKFGHNFDKKSRKNETFDEMLSKRGSYVARMSKIGCELSKRGALVESESKKGSMGESELEKENHCGHASLSSFFSEYPPPIRDFQRLLFTK